MATELGDRIRQLRERQEMTLDELARRANRDPATINDIETGDIEAPPRDVLARIARALGTTLNALLRQIPSSRRSRQDSRRSGRSFVLD